MAAHKSSAKTTKVSEAVSAETPSEKMCSKCGKNPADPNGPLCQPCFEEELRKQGYVECVNYAKCKRLTKLRTGLDPYCGSCYVQKLRSRGYVDCTNFATCERVTKPVAEGENPYCDRCRKGFKATKKASDPQSGIVSGVKARVTTSVRCVVQNGTPHSGAKLVKVNGRWHCEGHNPANTPAPSCLVVNSPEKHWGNLRVVEGGVVCQGHYCCPVRGTPHRGGLSVANGQVTCDGHQSAASDPLDGAAEEMVRLLADHQVVEYVPSEPTPRSKKRIEKRGAPRNSRKSNRGPGRYS